MINIINAYMDYHCDSLNISGVCYTFKMIMANIRSYSKVFFKEKEEKSSTKTNKL